MEEDIYLHKLNLRNVKPTAIRLLILRTMMEMNRAVSQPVWKKNCKPWISIRNI